jgi:signal transduction histidine kinase/ligand-binding sensor domain-containing protein
MSILSAILLVLLCASPLFALDPGQSVDQLYHTAWTARHGLPGAVLKVVQTTDGYLWVGTTDGLFRFDGLTFERYQPDSGALHASSVSALLAVVDGGLWVGYSRGGASFIKDGRVTNYSQHDGLPISTLRAFAVDPEGTVWAAAVGGLARLEGHRWVKVRMADWRYSCGSAWSLFVDRQGTLWVGGASPDNVLFLPKRAHAFQETGLAVPVYDFAEAADGTLWFQNEAATTIEAWPPVPAGAARDWPVLEVPASAVLFDRDGALWIAGANVRRIPSPSRLRGQSTATAQQAIESFTQEHGLTGSLVNDVFEDREGNIWIGTEGGLDRLRHRNLSWSRMRDRTALISLVPGENSDVWAVSSETPYLSRVQDDTIVPGAPAVISMAYRAPDGAFWLSARESFWRWKNGPFTEIRPPPEVHARRVPFKVISATADRAGGLWVSINGLGQFYRRDDQWRFIVVLSEIPDLTATAALTDAADRVWLLYRDTLAVLDHSRLRRRFSTTEGLDIGALLTMTEDGPRIWVGGESGLAFVHDDRVHRLRGIDALGPITGILLPSRDGAWLSAGAGIVHIPEDELRQALRDPWHRVSYQVLDLVSDLPEPLQRRYDGNLFTSAVEGRDGLLWFVTARGVVRVDRARLFTNRLPPPVVIRSVVADARPYLSRDRVALPALTRHLRIEYTALSLSIPERVRFRYRLDGWDTDWHEAGDERMASYTQLPPGRYVFRVRACNNDGVWNDSGATLAFIVAPAWFQTVWFGVFVIASIATALWLLYRHRMRQMAAALTARFDERLAERTRIARELHDTLLQTVQASKIVADEALGHDGNAEYVQNALRQVSEWLTRAVQEGRAALNSLRTSMAQANDLADALQRAIDSCVKPDSMTIALTVSGPRRDLHPIARDEIYRIAAEAIHNACLHSSASRVDVSLTYGHDLMLRVADNGVGVDPAITTHGKPGHFGLQGMRERAARLNARLTIVSSLRTSTEITLTVPGTVVFTTPTRSRAET